ncbi:hypothetical protein CPC_0986 [Clostridium perfringens C str. JGS1495]|nr:hypothetical protein CPC_0986 [Clostridium perfringens C str. JGS1495]
MNYEKRMGSMIESIYFLLKGTFLQNIYKVLRISVPIY